MKILHAISSTNPAGGGPIEGIRQLWGPLKELGADMEIACCDAPDASWLSTSGLPLIHALGPAHFKYGYTPRLLPWLREHAGRYDAVIVRGLWQYHGFAVWRALAGTKMPYFVFPHGMLDPWFKKTYPLKHLKKWLYWPWAEYRILRDAKAVIFTSEEECRMARRSFWLYRVHEAVTSYGTGGPPAQHGELSKNFMQAFPSLRDKRIVLFLSRIHEKKGCDLLLQAFAEVAKQDERLHLVMAGPDQTGWAAQLRGQAEKLGVAHRITWPGMLQGDMKWGAFYASEVFCLPSHQENFGIVVAEALACGKPVLISNKVNIWREIQKDGAGFVAEDTLEGTVANLECWLALDAKNYSAMSGRAVRCFENHFHIRQAAGRLLAIIQRGTTK